MLLLPNLFTLSLKAGVLSIKWKRVVLIPRHNKRCLRDFFQYRPNTYGAVIYRVNVSVANVLTWATSYHPNYLAPNSAEFFNPFHA